jgi:hypothetical protein
MRGKINVSSELNKGTVFVIDLPVNAEYRAKSNLQEINSVDSSQQESENNNGE